MSFDEIVFHAHGNGKIVNVWKVSQMPRNWREGQAWPAKYICEVHYNDARFNFDEIKPTIKAAKRWFKSWSTITEG